MITNKKLIDLENGSYSFSDYFKLNIKYEDLITLFGYSYQKEALEFKSNKGISWTRNLKKELEIILQKINISNEMMIREYLISPIISKLIVKYGINASSEDVIYYSETLRGTVDYLLEANNRFILIEAKSDDLYNGFKQLAVELIAFDKLMSEQNIDDKSVFGAVTIGTDWIFAKLDRDRKLIIKDIKIYRVPEELNKLVSALIDILGIDK